MNQAKASDIVDVTFHIIQNDMPVAKRVEMTRENFIKYNAMPKKRWADMYENIVKDKAYIRITDLSNNN